jgi:DNA-binding NarL/FixJ family response regulator
MDIRLVGQRDGVDAAIDLFRETGIRCLFATAHHDTPTQQRAQAAQPLGWVSKPYAPQALVQALFNAVAALRGA